MPFCENCHFTQLNFCFFFLELISTTFCKHINKKRVRVQQKKIRVLLWEPVDLLVYPTKFWKCPLYSCLINSVFLHFLFELVFIFPSSSFILLEVIRESLSFILVSSLVDGRQVVVTVAGLVVNGRGKVFIFVLRNTYELVIRK